MRAQRGLALVISPVTAPRSSRRLRRLAGIAGHAIIHKDLGANHRMRSMFDHLAAEVAVYVASSRETWTKRLRA
jgi:hypothetical protein